MENNLFNQFLQACKSGYINALPILINGVGVPVNYVNSEGMTGLHYAAQYGHYEVAKFLMDKGANLFALNNQQITPYELAREKRQISGSIVDLFDEILDRIFEQLDIKPHPHEYKDVKHSYKEGQDINGNSNQDNAKKDLSKDNNYFYSLPSSVNKIVSKEQVKRLNSFDTCIKSNKDEQELPSPLLNKRKLEIVEDENQLKKRRRTISYQR